MIQEMNEELVQPVIELVKRFMDIILVIDSSTSMEGKKIAVVNQAVKEQVTALVEAAKQNPEVEFRVRCIVFSDSARYHIGPDPVTPSQISWSDLTTRGGTSTGEAVLLLAESIKADTMPPKGYPPVMVLLSDGENTDGGKYEQAIDRLETEPWGRKAIRLAIGIGNGYNRTQLERFANQPEVGVLEAKNAVDLANYLRYSIVTAPLSSISSINDPKKSSNNALPKAPAQTASGNDPRLEVF